MKQKSYREILDLVAADSLEEQNSLWSQIASRLERKTFMTTLRTRPMLAALIALLILFMLSGVAYAIGRSLGYVPGVGMIDQSAPLRVLAETVSVTRDGITFTVEDAILSSDKTIILYSIENAPITEIYQDHAVIGCTSASNLRLSNGTSFASFDLLMGKGRMTFDPIPITINDVILFIPCLPNTAPGTAPENWELSLRFITAPPERVNSLPVIEYTPQAPIVAATDVKSEGAGQNALSITKVVDAGDNYILMGEFRSSIAPQNSLEHSIKLIDANDAEVLWEIPGDIDPTFSPGSEFWAAQFDKKQAFPISVEYSESIIRLDPAKVESYEFEFDAGANPQIGQTWNLNREIQSASYPFTLTSINVSEAQGSGCQECRYEYTFAFAMPESVQMISPIPNINPPFDTGLPLRLPDGKVNITAVEIDGEVIGGSMGQAESGHWKIVSSRPNILKGNVKVRISTLPGSSETKEWALNWQPDGYAPSADSASAPQPCLTFDSWKAALAAPASIPANLGGKVALSLLNEDLSSFHAFISNLDGSEKMTINNTEHISLSPDGRHAVYTRIGEGLYLVDLSTGEEHLLPYAEQDDSKPYWIKPFWSPDGTKLSYIHDGFYIINVDGTGLRKIFDGNTIFDSFGWSSDSEKLFLSLINPNGFPKITEVDLATNTTRDLLSAQGQKFIIRAAAVSPDGSRIAFVRTYGGSGVQIIYISNTDGSTPAPVARSDEGWNFSSHLVWSADGQWLLISVSNTKNDLYGLHPMNALVNPQTCQIIQLPLEGNVQSWVP